MFVISKPRSILPLSLFVLEETILLVGFDSFTRVNSTTEGMSGLPTASPQYLLGYNIVSCLKFTVQKTYKLRSIVHSRNYKEVTRVKVGSYSIPDLRLFPKIYDNIKLIYENYRREEAEDEEAVAKLCGHKSAKSGAWFSKLADMRLYGLLEQRGLKATDLAEKLTYGMEEEQQEAVNKAVLNISLWKELYSRFGVELPESNFWVQLQRITGLDPLEAQKHADSIRKAYLDDASHIKAKKKPERGGLGEMSSGIDISMSTINIQAGQFSQTIPWTEEGIELAKGFLDLLGQQLKTEEKPKEKTSKGEG